MRNWAVEHNVTMLSTFSELSLPVWQGVHCSGVA